MKITYTLGALINLLTLVVGLTVGFFMGTARVKVVYAQVTPQQTQIPVAQPSTDFEEITPTVTMGSAGIHTLLAHRIATDELMVNGYNILLIDDGILNLLQAKGIANYHDVEALAERAKVPKPLRIKMPEQPTSTQPTPPAPSPSK